MTYSRSIRPLFACVSVLALVACNGNTPPNPSSHAPAPAAQAAQPQAGGLRATADKLAADGNCAAAIPIYRQLAASDGDAGAMTALAECLLKQGAREEAVGVLKTLETRGQLTGHGYYLLGKTDLAMGDYAKAEAALAHAQALNPGDPKALSGHGVALAALGRTEDAMAVFAGAVDPISLSNEALVMAASGHPEDAALILEPLVRAGKVGVQGRQNLAMAYLLSGREADAFNMARVDLDEKSTDETFTFYRGLKDLPADKRMQALVTGTIDPSWTNQKAGNLSVDDSATQQAAAKRLVPEPKQPEPVKPKPAPKPEPVVDRSKYELKEVPPLLEPEGWALQIAAYRTIKELMRGWTILYRQSGDLLKDIPPRRSEMDFGPRAKKPTGFFYRLNAGPLKTLKEAQDLCTALKKRGTDCWIRPPEKSEGKLPASDAAKKKKKTVKAGTDKL